MYEIKGDCYFILDVYKVQLSALGHWLINAGKNNNIYELQTLFIHVLKLKLKFRYQVIDSKQNCIVNLQW